MENRSTSSKGVKRKNPAAGNMSTPVFIGSEPTRMAFSDNAEVLYALASDANEIVRFNTLTQKTEGSFGPPDGLRIGK